MQNGGLRCVRQGQQGIAQAVDVSGQLRVVCRLKREVDWAGRSAGKKHV